MVCLRGILRVILVSRSWLLSCAVGFGILIVMSNGGFAQSVYTHQQVHPIRQAQRLSEWLQTPTGQSRLEFDPALAWISSDTARLQQPQQSTVREILRSKSLMAINDPAGANRLLRLLDALPYQGRVVLHSANGRWLEANPQSDPVLKPGDRIVSFSRPQLVTVVLSNGRLCNITHAPGQTARAYVRHCSKESPSIFDGAFWHSGSWAWIAQPDGRVAKTGVGATIDRSSMQPAPGAWIWAPSEHSGFEESFSQQFAELLAAQGPAGAYLRPVTQETLTHSFKAPAEQNVSRNQWGSVGLIQMPTARMAPDSELAVSRTVTDPYRRINIFIQALPWMEFGFRYTDIRNRYYGDSWFSGDQTYKDKSIDTKFRLSKETDYVPEFSVGLIDVGGTGLFSSEFLAASKRFGDLDVTAGLAWGYLGSGASFSNPLGSVSSRFKTRQASDAGPGGKFAGSTWFTGPMGFFGGIEYKTPIPKLVAKLEYDANNHKSEPYKSGEIYTVPAATSRFNYGLAYRLSDWIDLSAGVERGNQLSFGVVLYSAMNKMPPPKLLDDPNVSVAPIAADTRTNPTERTMAAWQSTREEIERVTSWKVVAIERDDQDLYVTFSETYGLYVSDRVELIARILHRDAPSSFRRFVIELRTKGMPINAITIDRTRFVEDRTELVSSDKKLIQPAIIANSPQSISAVSRDLLDSTGQKEGLLRNGALSGGIGMSYSHHLGGPDGFWLYQIGANVRAEWRPRNDTWLIGIGNYRLLDNYSDFKINSWSQLPQVRTRMKEYYTASRWTLPVVQATHMGEVPLLGSGHYYSVYAGMLEWMFGGYGAEYLYRPWSSRFALGVDLNRVQQRAYEQDFRFLDYRATTGHVSGYWDTGWQDVMATVRVGQYLAGDRGITLDLSRVFANGVTFGMYATRTNISAEKFGEGSFDKGVYLTIPFDAVLPKRSTFSGTFAWQPITRDGGAILGRSYTLFGMTGQRSPRALNFGKDEN